MRRFARTATLSAIGGLLLAHDAAAKGPASSAAAASSAVASSGAAARAADTPPANLPPKVAARNPPSLTAPIMPLSEVRAGMLGEAWTVFQGTRAEPFKIRVVSVLRNFIPKQDVVLMRAEDPRVEFSGIAAGMSGSPVYIDGKLMGAIAYAWSFSKEPLAGVTPIEAMLAERQRPRRAVKDQFFAHGGGGLPTASSRPASIDEPRLQPVSVPIAVSGVAQIALDELATQLKPFGMIPVRSGGAGRSRTVSTKLPKLEPGSPIGVELVRGDMSAVAMGTLTHVQGDMVIGFGHPMFGIGEVNLPLVFGEVHAFMPSLAASFKMASPIAEIGAVVQDRPSCIVGDLSQRATMVPVEVRVSAPGLETRIFRAEVARNRRLTPVLASMVVTSAIADTEPDVAEMAVTLTSKIDVRGVGAVELRDQIFSNEGISPRLLSGSRSLRALADVLQNPFEPTLVDRMDVDVRIEFRRDVAEIVGVSLPGDMVRAGDTVPLRVQLRPYAGAEYTETVPIVIPRSLAGQAVKVEVASGAMVRPDTAKPESLRGYIDNLRTYYTASSIVVSLSTADDGASLRGHLIPNLPQGALDTLRPGNQTRRAEGYRVAERTVHASPRFVNGKQELTLFVSEDLLGRNR